MALWLHRSGRHCEHEAKFLTENRIYLSWGGLAHNLGKLKDRKDVQAILTEIYPNFEPKKQQNHASQIWAFSHRMSPGDWVCVPSKRKTIHIGEITGEYTFVPNGEDPYYHYRTVKWLEKDIPRTNFNQDILYAMGAICAICQIKRNDAETRVRAMQANDWKSVGIKVSTTGKDGTPEDDPDGVPDLDQIARDHIARLIFSKYKGHGMELLVEAILRAQGFTTYHSDKGPDGGIDILAAPDTLGFGHPRICVQVKSQDTPLERPVLDQLVGTMQNVQADQGLLVCWGGFKPTIQREIGRLFFKVRLWDQNDLIDHFLANYDKFDEDLRAELPLKRIWTVASTEDDDDE
jgi:restriction system protein